MTWRTYATALIVLQVVHFVVLYLMLRFQDLLPFNPQGQSGLAPKARVQHRHVVRDQHQLAGLCR